jgi:hypothetical protein
MNCHLISIIAACLKFFFITSCDLSLKNFLFNIALLSLRRTSSRADVLHFQSYTNIAGIKDKLTTVYLVVLFVIGNAYRKELLPISTR